MKKYYFLLIALSFFACTNAQIISFTDVNLKSKLLAASASNSIAQDLNGINFKIDANNDNEIQVSEALNVSRLLLSGSNIANLEGIQYFTNLKELYCDTNILTALDLTSLSNLELLNCQSNQLTSLNVAGLTQLATLECDANQLSTLNLTSLTNLQWLVCSDNLLTNLQISNLANLSLVQTGNNYLTAIDLNAMTNLEHFYCENNQITQLDFSQCPALYYCECNNNELTYINMKNGHADNIFFIDNPNIAFICLDAVEENYVQQKLADYGYTNCTVSTTSCTLKIDSNLMPDFAIYPNPAGNVLNIESMQKGEVRNVTIYNTLGQIVLVVPNIQNSKTIDVSNLVSGNYLIRIVSDKETSYAKLIKK